MWGMVLIHEGMQWKIVRPYYLSNDKGYLIVSSADIVGVHGLILDSNYLLEHLQRIIKLSSAGVVIMKY